MNILRRSLGIEAWVRITDFEICLIETDGNSIVQTTDRVPIEPVLSIGIRAVATEAQP